MWLLQLPISSVITITSQHWSDTWKIHKWFDLQTKGSVISLTRIYTESKMELLNHWLSTRIPSIIRKRATQSLLRILPSSVFWREVQRAPEISTIGKEESWLLKNRASFMVSTNSMKCSLFSKILWPQIFCARLFLRKPFVFTASQLWHSSSPTVNSRLMLQQWRRLFPKLGEDSHGILIAKLQYWKTSSRVASEMTKLS